MNSLQEGVSFIPSISGPNLTYSFCAMLLQVPLAPNDLRGKQRVCTDLNCPEKCENEPNKNPKDNVESCLSTVGIWSIH